MSRTSLTSLSAVVELGTEQPSRQPLASLLTTYEDLRAIEDPAERDAKLLSKTANDDERACFRKLLESLEMSLVKHPHLRKGCTLEDVLSFAHTFGVDVDMGHDVDGIVDKIAAIGECDDEEIRHFMRSQDNAQDTFLWNHLVQHLE